MRDLVYCCPITKQPLRKEGDAFLTESGTSYKLLSSAAGNDIPVFISADQLTGGDVISNAMYAKDDAEESYDNFLSWLFLTFDQDEREFRLGLIERLGVKPDYKVLVTGCGLGDDLKYLYPILREQGELYAQDLSDLMVAAASRRMTEMFQNSENLHLSVSNASALPFPDGYFDAAYHFGGINLFSDIPSAIDEMARVTKVGGRVLIGDEGVAPWLKNKEFGKVAIRNIALWASDPPLQYIPEYSRDVNLSWVLGNCFYIIDFTVSCGLPYMNIDLVHKGARGGSMRTRYFGQLEGVDPNLKARVQEASAGAGKSASQWIEDALRLQLDSSK
ncbi:class I SAM-dependent methyltransferase [Pseudomonas sp. O230]|uniref:class I SAM-dependent methyltransferase n=1 Tax=Pseudomonas sp. O230 TaxID=3159450 RepID=UPI00387AD151